MSLFDKSELESFLIDTKSNRQETALKRAEFLAWLDELKDELKEQINSEVTLAPELKDERLKIAKDDYLYFAKTYFSHYFSIKGDCELHTYLASIFTDIANSNNGVKYATAAPRGYAKTTHTCVIFVLWLICFSKKHFIVEISDAIELVETNIEAIKAELEANANLKADFPDVCGVGKVWKVGEFVSKNGIKVKAYGSGKRLRGVKHGTYRPDVAIIDDLENDTNVRSKDQRDKLESWLDEAVLNLGSVDGRLSVVYIGTILHNDSVLSRKLKLSFWHPRLFRAIISFPVRSDLWDEYASIYKAKGKESASKFYIKNKRAMDEGAEVLWQSAADIEALMRKRAENPKAFNKEQLNTPLSDMQKFRRDEMSFYTSLPKIDYKILYADPAGSGKKSDFTSITILGINKEQRKCYVIESFNSIMQAKAIINKICDFQSEHRCKTVAIETNGGQFFLKSWLLERAFDRGIFMPLRGVHNKASKSERIEELELPITNGEIVFHKSQSILLEQLEFYPEIDHDDAPDSLAGAYALSKLKKKKKPRSRYFAPRKREYDI